MLTFRSQGRFQLNKTSHYTCAFHSVSCIKKKKSLQYSQTSIKHEMKNEIEVKPISFFILIYFKVTPKGYMAQKGMRGDSLSVWRS